MGVQEKMTGAQRTARYRAAKRAQGLRQKQIWVPDVRSAKVLQDIRRGVEVLNAADKQDGVMEYLGPLNDALMDSLPPYHWDEELKR